MKGMILAAGFGTRLRPVTYTTPKPLVPLCNRPLIGYAVDSLVRAGVHDIIVNLHHLPEAMKKWLDEEFAGVVNFHYSYEKEILGTGGGVRNVREQLGDEPFFFLVNGDTIQRPPLDRLAAAITELDALAALSLRHPPQGDRFTKVFFDGQRVTGFREGSGEALMFSGSHAISRRIFDRLPDRPFSGITEDVYTPVILDGSDVIAGVVDDGVWFDIGTPQRYLSASNALQQLMCRGEFPLPPRSMCIGNSIVADDVKISGVVDDSTFWFGSRVNEATVAGSSVWDRVTIESASSVVDSIVATGVRLPSGSNVRNALVCQSVEGIEYEENVVRRRDLVGIAVDPALDFVFEIPEG